MPYTPQTWTNDVSKLNATRMTYIEDGIDDAHDTADAAIPKPSSPSADQALIWNGTTWVASSIANANISSSAAIGVSKIAAGSDGQYLKTVGSTPTWSTLSVTSNVSRQTNTTAVGTGANTAETDLQTITISADTLTTGDLVTIAAGGTVTNAAGSLKTFRLYFGGTILITEGDTSANNWDWYCRAEVVVTGASSQESIAFLNGSTSTGSNIWAVCDGAAPAAAVNGSIIVKTTGQTGNASDEVTSEVLTITIIKA